MSWLQSVHHIVNFFHLVGVSASTQKTSIFSSKKRRFEDKKGGDAAEAVAMVKDRSAQGQGDGDGEIVVNRESLEIQN